MPVTINKGFVKEHVSSAEIEQIAPFVYMAHRILTEGSGRGSEFRGWLKLPCEIEDSLLLDICQTAEQIREQSDVVLVAGIGGSYLGARAAIELLCSPMYNQLPDRGGPAIYFVGNDLSGSHLNEVLKICKDKRVSVIVISKSGTTTETALAFRVLRAYMQERYGQEAARRIYAVTDKAKGTLKQLSVTEGYKSFVIDDDIGGRFSVLSPVGLLPIACAGVDIRQLVAGAKHAQTELAEGDVTINPCLEYVALRNILYRKGRAIEVYVGYDPCQQSFTEWLKQLFGESEGKDGKGIFPAGVQYSTDLHSMGQYLQDGSRILFETGILIKEDTVSLTVPDDPDDLDGLNFLSGRSLQEINSLAALGVAIAHQEGGTPTILLELPNRSAYELGYLFYFFMLACGVSGYLLGVNPFDQPGVEGYKKNMFALLGKPGYQELTDKLNHKLQKSF